MAEELEHPVVESGVSQETQDVGGTEAREQPIADSNQGVPEEQFFDPQSLPPELLSTYKKMQQAFSRKTQAIARERDKIAAYDDFVRDPHGNLRRMAAEYGVALQQPAGNTQQQLPDNWQPKDWQEVLARSAEHVSPRIREEIMSQFQPIVTEFQRMKQREIERSLDEASPDWRLYEDEMVSLLKQHPSLVNDPKLLVKLSVPDSVMQKHASASAMKKVQRKVESAKNSTGSTTSRSPSPNTDRPMTFNEAVVLAKQQLAKKGVVY